MNAHDERITEFRRLHSAGSFVMPNPWDVGSAVLLEQMGFPALATTSAGFAWTLGRTDKAVGLEEMLEHLAAIADAVALPVNADFEGGYAVDPDQVGANVSRAVATGVAGLSIEDSTGDDADPLLPIELAVERVRAARAAIDETGRSVVLTARSEGFVAGRPDVGETIRRLSAYAEAGADCLYAPWLTSLDHVASIVAAVSPQPVNLVIHRPFTTVAEAAAVGVRRISVGGALAKAAWRGFLDAAHEIAERGTFSQLAGLPDVDGLMAP